MVHYQSLIVARMCIYIYNIDMHIYTQYINMHVICTLRHPPEKMQILGHLLSPKDSACGLTSQLHEDAAGVVISLARDCRLQGGYKPTLKKCASFPHVACEEKSRV